MAAVGARLDGFGAAGYRRPNHSDIRAQAPVRRPDSTAFQRGSRRALTARCAPAKRLGIKLRGRPPRTVLASIAQRAGAQPHVDLRGALRGEYSPKCGPSRVRSRTTAGALAMPDCNLMTDGAPFDQGIDASRWQLQRNRSSSRIVSTSVTDPWKRGSGQFHSKPR